MSDAMVAQFAAPASWPANSILPVQCNPLDGSLDAVVVDLDAAVGQKSWRPP
jgi:hypothetical protein